MLVPMKYMYINITIGQEITNPECLRDCFEDTPCVALLLDDPTCCTDTEAELSKQECIQSVFKSQPLVYSALAKLVNDPSSNCFGTNADTEWICFQLVEIDATFADLATCQGIFVPSATPPACSGRKRR